MASIDALYHSFHSSDRDPFLDAPCSQIAVFNITSPASRNNESLHSSFSHDVNSDDIQFSPTSAYNIDSLVQQEDSYMLPSDLVTVPGTSVFDDTTGNTICDTWSSLVSEPALQLVDVTHEPDTPNEIYFHEDFLSIPPPQSPPPLPPLDAIRASSTHFATGNNIHSTPGRLKHHACKYFAKKPSKFLKKPFPSSSSSKREEIQRSIHLKPVCNSTNLIADLKKNGAKVDNIVPRTSKNVISERRRRKMFNDKLYSLRALVPKISKMDKASIVRDAVEHVQHLQKQVALKQQQISYLQSRLTKRRQRLSSSSSKMHPSEKVLKMDVMDMEEGTYHLRVECIKGKWELLQMSKALDALHFDILSANYVSIGDCSLNTLVFQAKILNSMELKEMILDIFPKFGLSFMQERG